MNSTNLWSRTRQWIVRRDQQPSGDDDGPNPLLQPVPLLWSRAIGVVLLSAMAGMSVLLGFAVVQHVLHPVTRVRFTSSLLIFLLMLMVVWGFCWQAGWRLLLRRPGEPGSLFSWPVWLALGGLLLTLTGIVAALTIAKGVPSGQEIYMLVSMTCIGGWCLWLAWRGARSDIL